ncbi:MAG: hypothetical protein GF310_13010 [candidate division Zixibacteria bacterium]|nr:hypothetical protein [candidate division Zixibacteria bacterium]
MPCFNFIAYLILQRLILFIILFFAGTQIAYGDNAVDSVITHLKPSTVIRLDSLKLDKSGQYDLFCDFSGNLFILDSDQNSIMKISGDGEVMNIIGGFGFGVRQFNSPRAMASTDGGLNIYILDAENRRVVRLTNSLKWINQFEVDNEPGGKVIGELTGIAVNSQKEIFISDPRNLRIIKFTQQGRFLEEIEGRSEFIEPGEIVIDKDDYLYVAGMVGIGIYLFDNLGNYVRKYSADDTESIGSIAVDESYFYYHDLNSSRIRVLSKKLLPLFELNIPAESEKKMSRAQIASGLKGRVWILDINHNRIYGYDPVKK